MCDHVVTNLVAAAAGGDDDAMRILLNVDDVDDLVVA